MTAPVTAPHPYAPILHRDSTSTSITPRVHAIVTAVEQGRALEAFETFYADDVVMQENLMPPTVGKAADRERVTERARSAA